MKWLNRYWLRQGFTPEVESQRRPTPLRLEPLPERIAPTVTRDVSLTVHSSLVASSMSVGGMAGFTDPVYVGREGEVPLGADARDDVGFVAQDLLEDETGSGAFDLQSASTEAPFSDAGPSDFGVPPPASQQLEPSADDTSPQSGSSSDVNYTLVTATAYALPAGLDLSGEATDPVQNERSPDTEGSTAKPTYQAYPWGVLVFDFGRDYRSGAFLTAVDIDDKAREDVLATQADSVPFTSMAVSTATPAALVSTASVVASGFDGRSVALATTGGGSAFQVSVDAGYDNEVGLYQVYDADVRADGIAHSEEGYAAHALAGVNRIMLHGTQLGDGIFGPVAFLPSTLYSFYLVQNDSSKHWLSENARNLLEGGPLAIFSYSAANPDGVDHVRAEPGNRFGFKDLNGGADRDFDDFVRGIRFVDGASCAPNFDRRTIAAGADTVTTGRPLSQSAGYANEVGLYKVVDADEVVGGLKPGDAGYAAAALADGNRIVVQPSRFGGRLSDPVALRAVQGWGMYLEKDHAAAEKVRASTRSVPSQIYCKSIHAIYI